MGSEEVETVSVDISFRKHSCESQEKDKEVAAGNMGQGRVLLWFLDGKDLSMLKC